jgi:transposase
VQPLLPGAVAGTTAREVVNALLFILKWGCSWHPLPGDLPSYPTILAVVRDWQRAGSWEAIDAALRRHIWWPDLRRDAQETITSFDEQHRVLASLFARPEVPSGAEHVDRDTLFRERSVGKASAP